ncbi:hypothetical protein C4D60_Mb02t08030 [Musa balbisiana]|uniref:Uncharacterized protein n=1 Tax=Musa balbisiana TaxID=52838 RepID=A0A4S8I932_MUSBA|nr:hypothetical protein C4D60_Mb02t08030 [Musa balbisiana]
MQSTSNDQSQPAVILGRSFNPMWATDLGFFTKLNLSIFSRLLFIFIFSGNVNLFFTFFSFTFTYLLSTLYTLGVTGTPRATASLKRAFALSD